MISKKIVYIFCVVFFLEALCSCSKITLKLSQLPGTKFPSSDISNDSNISSDSSEPSVQPSKPPELDIIQESWTHVGTANSSTVSSQCMGVARRYKDYGIPEGADDHVCDGADVVAGLGTDNTITYNGYECYDATEYTCQIEYWIFKKINELRNEVSKPNLSPNVALSYASRQWSAFQAESGSTHHNNSKRSGCINALYQINFKDIRNNVYSFGGAENCFGIYAFNPDDQTPERVADYLVQGWKNSPGHYENILGPYPRIGIGVVQAKDKCTTNSFFKNWGKDVELYYSTTIFGF